MSDMIVCGKVLYWGMLEWSVDEICVVCEIVEWYYLYKLVVEQLQYNLFYCIWVEQEYVWFYDDYGFGFMIWSLLVLGLFIGKYCNGVLVGSCVQLQGYDWMCEWLIDWVVNDIVEWFGEIVVEFGCSIGQLVIVWVLLNLCVSLVIMGVLWIDQIGDNMCVFEVVVKLMLDVK